MEAATKEKLQSIVTLVNKAMIDPDIEIDYCIPGVEETVKATDASEDPYILLTYALSDYNKHTRKVHLGKTMLMTSAEDVSNKVTASIEEFKSEIEAVEMGA